MCVTHKFQTNRLLEYTTRLQHKFHRPERNAPLQSVRTHMDAQERETPLEMPLVQKRPLELGHGILQHLQTLRLYMGVCRRKFPQMPRMPNHKMERTPQLLQMSEMWAQMGISQCTPKNLPLVQKPPLERADYLLELPQLQ